MCYLVMSSDLLSYLVFHSLFYFSKYHSNHLKDNPKIFILFIEMYQYLKNVVQKTRHQV